MLLPVYRGRIVARFRCEGKPDTAWKSRIFNNLGRTLRDGLARYFDPRRAGQPPGPRFGGTGAIVVLVE
jgi:hypothetical protein